MTREDFENGLIARLEDIRAFYKQYNPAAFEDTEKVFLSMAICRDTLSANNCYYTVDEGNPDYTHPVNCWKTGDSKIYHSNN